jgi:hypothetical protein
MVIIAENNLTFLFHIFGILLSSNIILLEDETRYIVNRLNSHLKPKATGFACELQLESFLSVL